VDHSIIQAIEKILSSKFVNIQNEYLDVQDTCLFLGISKSTLYKINFEKKIPYYKANGAKKVYYKKSDLIAYITQNRLKSKAEIEAEARQFSNKGKGASNV
tara:strand:+ start:12555 stop:12857 length:303 start_codon:yes stop_codon:yes gene_type:complete